MSFQTDFRIVTNTNIFSKALTEQNWDLTRKVLNWGIDVNRCDQSHYLSRFC
jgi:hypothetical protein